MMAALSSRALHEHLSVIMAALTRAAVAEICGLVDEGYAALQLEINRSRNENEALKKKLLLIEAIVIREGGGGARTEEPEVHEPEVHAPAEDAPQPQQRQRDGGEGGAAVPHAEFPDVVLIKDEDSDSDDSFGEEKQKCVRETTTAVTSSVKRRRSGDDETETPSSTDHVSLKASRRTSAATAVVYTVDSPPRSEADASASACSYASQTDAAGVHQEASLLPLYFSGSATLDGGDVDDDDDGALTWTKTPKSHTAFPQFHQSEDSDDASDAFGLKLLSVSGGADNSDAAFEYADGFGLYANCGAGKRYVCSVCHKTYASSQNLDVHMRIHTGERPFRCEQCGKRFTQSAHLKSHVSVHTGERPHVCGVRRRSFIVKHSLKLHVSKCHPEVSLPPE